MGTPVFDARKLEDLHRLTSLFDFLSNPQGYKDFLAEVKETLAKMDTTIAAHTTVQEAEKYLAAAKVKVSEVNAFVEGQKQAVAQEKELAESHVKTLHAALGARELKVALKERESTKTQEEVSERMVALVEKEKQLEQVSQELEIKATHLSSKELELAAKLQKLSELSAVFK